MKLILALFTFLGCISFTNSSHAKTRKDSLDCSVKMILSMDQYASNILADLNVVENYLIACDTQAKDPAAIRLISRSLGAMSGRRELQRSFFRNLP